MVTFVGTMLFKANEFEQSFRAKTLKKGLRLFERGEVELLSRLANNEYRFLIAEDIELVLKKRGEKIVYYSCSCGDSSFCEHLSAVLFYFQKDTLGIAVKKTTRKRSVKISESTISPDFKQFLSGIAQPDLVNFIENYSDRNELFKENLQAWFSGRSGEKILHLYRIQIKIILERYLHYDKLTQQQIDELHQKLSNLITETSIKKNKLNDLFFLRLAFIAELPVVFNHRLLGNESGILNIIEDAMKDLDHQFDSGLSKSQQIDWFGVCLTAGAVKNKVALKIISFLVPRVLSFVNDKKQFDELKLTLQKKRIKSNALNQFDTLEIIKLELAIKDAELFNTPFAFKNYRQTPEFVMAQAELFFAANKTDKGFSTLEQFYEEIKADRSGFMLPFLDYMILKAQEKNNDLLEIKCLEESMVFGIYISSAQAHRYFELVGSSNQNAAVDRIIKKIKERSKDQSLDKISVLLLSENRLDALASELKNFKNKFTLVHKIALLKLPAFDSNFLRVYSRHLSEALTDGAYVHYHQQIFLTAQKYLEQLPEDKARSIVNDTLNKLGSLSQIYKFIRGTYPEVEKIKVVRTNKLRG